MTEPITTICPHGPCTCEVPQSGTHCSDACADHDGDGCGCGHAVCDAFAGRAIDQDTLDPHTIGESMEAAGAALDPTQE